MKILLLGKNGQVGWELQRTLAPLGTVLACDRTTCDLADADVLHATVQAAQPDFIVNAAAYNAVDRAESESDKAFAINGAASGLLAELAKSLGAVLVHYSTDFVFDGEKGTPYVETDPVNPLSVYGRSKLAGEQAIQSVDGGYLILRTSWVYSTRRPSFVTKVQGWARRFPQLKIVTDQVGSPTWARMLAEITAQLVAMGSGKIAERTGLYHLGGKGAVSRNEWAQAILKYDPHPEEIATQEILPATSMDFPTPAVRPVYSALDCSLFEETFDLRLPDWETTLQMALE